MRGVMVCSVTGLSTAMSVEQGGEKRKHPEAQGVDDAQYAHIRGTTNTNQTEQINSRNCAMEGGKEHRKAAVSRGVAGDGPDGRGDVQCTCGERALARGMLVARRNREGHVGEARQG